MKEYNQNENKDQDETEYYIKDVPGTKKQVFISLSVSIQTLITILACFFGLIFFKKLPIVTIIIEIGCFISFLDKIFLHKIDKKKLKNGEIKPIIACIIIVCFIFFLFLFGKNT